MKKEIHINLNWNVDLSNLKFLFMPHFWLLNERVDAAWDADLNQLLDTHGETAQIDETGCTLILGDVEVWISNYPYAYGTCWNYWSKMNGRPRRKTILRLRKIELEARKKPYERSSNIRKTGSRRGSRA